MSSHSNSSSSSSSSDRDDRNPNSDSNPEPEQEPDAEPNTNPDLIDKSLDALENQLASISMSSRSPTATLDDEEEVEEEEEKQSLEQPKIKNGSLSDEIGAEGATYSVEDENIESNLKAESSGVIKESLSSVWRNISEVDEVERPLSPGSSGYAGERGSTSGGDEINDDDEHNNEIREVENDGVLGSHDQWVSGKRHPDEVSWTFSSFP